VSFLSVYGKHFIDFHFIATTARRESFPNQIRLFADETNVEHRGTVAAALWAAQR
jgi:hypothetical protein